MLVEVSNLDVVFLSFDEPNADFNYADLKTKIPRAKRSHGVMGFDAAHKAASNIAETDIFLTVDGDNIVDPEVLGLKIFINDNLDSFAISLNAINSVNGLEYGNGSIKIWSKRFVESMRSHEAADPSSGKTFQTDFRWGSNYFPTYNTTYSTTVINHNFEQAWRSGFREGVKMMMNYVDNGGIKSRLIASQLHKLMVWACVGSDQPNGIAVMDAAVHGAYMTLKKEIDPILISDYAWFQEYIASVTSTFHRTLEMRGELAAVYGLDDFNPLSVSDSKWFKRFNTQKDFVRLTKLKIDNPRPRM